MHDTCNALCIVTANRFSLPVSYNVSSFDELFDTLEAGGLDGIVVRGSTNFFKNGPIWRFPYSKNVPPLHRMFFAYGQDGEKKGTEALLMSSECESLDVQSNVLLQALHYE